MTASRLPCTHTTTPAKPLATRQRMIMIALGFRDELKRLGPLHTQHRTMKSEHTLKECVCVWCGWREDAFVPCRTRARSNPPPSGAGGSGLSAPSTCVKGGWWHPCSSSRLFHAQSFALGCCGTKCDIAAAATTAITMAETSHQRLSVTRIISVNRREPLHVQRWNMFARVKLFLSVSKISTSFRCFEVIDVPCTDELHNCTPNPTVCSTQKW